MSCFGKLFTAVINTRLTLFVEDNKLLGEEQAGFRKKYSTADHMFLLRNVVDLYLANNRRLHVAFVDFKKSFDKVDRISLWWKLVDNCIN